MEAESQHRFQVRFESSSPAHANRAAGELRRFIRSAAAGGVEVEVHKDDRETQDLGSTLVVLLGTPALVAVARGIRDYVAKTGDRVVIETPDGTVVARGDAAQELDVAAAVAALRGQGA